MKKISLLFCLIMFLGFQSIGQSDQEMVEETTSESIIRAHMGFLASDALKGRDVNTDGGMAAAEYIKSQFMRYGVKHAPGMDGYFQEVGLRKVTPPTGGTMTFKKTSVEHGTDFVMLEGDNGMIEGKYIFVNYGTAEDFEKVDVKDKIVLAICGNGEDGSPRDWFMAIDAKKKRAKEKGAIAVVEIYQSIQMPWKRIVPYLQGSQLEFDEGDNFPHFWLGSSNLDFIKTLRSKGKKGKNTLSINIEGRVVDAFTTPNVVGIIEGTDPKLKNEYVIYSAHYDHVGVGRPDAEGDSIYNGARDNAIGTTGVISAAEHFSKYPTKRSALFIAFTAEEKGLLGSKWFAKHPPFPLKQVAYCFNIDNAGYNDTSLVTVFGLGRTTAERHMVDACKAFGLRAIDDPAPEQNLFDRSDNVSFAEKGIPAPTFSMGFTAFDDDIYKYYHQAGDEIESMDFPYLLKYIRSFLLSGRFIANDPAKPFWTEGDKYYEKGVELYGKELID